MESHLLFQPVPSHLVCRSSRLCERMPPHVIICVLCAEEAEVAVDEDAVLECTLHTQDLFQKEVEEWVCHFRQPSGLEPDFLGKEVLPHPEQVKHPHPSWLSYQ